MDVIKKINLMLVYSMPFFLIFSHSVADAIVVFTGLTFLILLFFNKIFVQTKNLLRDKVIISLFIFYFILVFSSFLSEFQSLSLKRSIPYIRFIFFVAAMKYWLLTDKKTIKILTYSFAACLLFVSFDVIFQYFNYKYVPINPELGNSPENLIKKGFDIFGYPSKDYYRFQGPFKDEYIAGGFILRLSPFLFLVAFSIYKLKKDNFSKILIILSAALIIYSIYITGDRAPFFMLFLISTLLILSLFNKKIILIFLSSLILIIFLAGLNVDKKNRYLGESLHALGFQNNEFTLDTGYGHLFYSAIKIWIDKPFIGVGTKNYRKICYRKEYNFESKNNHQLCSTHPHNYVLELLSETGLLGLISFYSIFFYLLRDFELVKKVLQKNLNYIYIKFSLISLIIILWPISTTGSILTNKNSVILWLIFGLTYSAINIKKKSSL